MGGKVYSCPFFSSRFFHSGKVMLIHKNYFKNCPFRNAKGKPTDDGRRLSQTQTYTTIRGEVSLALCLLTELKMAWNGKEDQF